MELLAHDDDDDGAVADKHPLATQEWLASRVLAKFAESGDALALCKLGLINKTFFAASKTHLVWQKLLPPASHMDFLCRECDDAHELLQWRYINSKSKKALYQRLCRPITLAGGLKKFWLHQGTSGECYMISARPLDVRPDPLVHLEWLLCRGAWFSEVAILFRECSACRFNIKGNFRLLLKPGSYTISFRMLIHSAYPYFSKYMWFPQELSLKNTTYAHEDIKSSTFFRSRYSDPPLLVPPLLEDAEDRPSADDPYQSDLVKHVWVEYDVGEFIVAKENEDSPIEVELLMCVNEASHSNTSFLVDGVFIRPTCIANAAHEQKPNTPVRPFYIPGY